MEMAPPALVIWNGAQGALTALQHGDYKDAKRIVNNLTITLRAENVELPFRESAALGLVAGNCHDFAIWAGEPMDAGMQRRLVGTCIMLAVLLDYARKVDGEYNNLEHA